MSSRNCSVTRKGTVAMLVDLHKHYLKLGLNYDELTDAALPVDQGSTTGKYNSLTVLTKIGFICSLIALIIDLGGLKLLLGIRCFVPHNYFTWEATRPLSDCSFCSNVTQAIELSNNITRNEFEPYAYSSMPIVIRGAFLHWPAMETFNYQYFKELYARMDPVYSSTESECQFLHFKSNFVALKDVFNMSKSRVENAKGEKSWYVGWENCYAEVQQELKKHFPIPHFLPEDAEIPNNAYVFMGYDEGASLHLDFINRLMWQAQLRGSKIWQLRPPPECQNTCTPLSFEVHPGDAVLVDTRVWYHATTIPEGQLSISLHLVYG